MEFGRGANADCWFDFGLDFTGWRTCWVRLGYDTEGTPHTAMNRVRFIAPQRTGELFIDQVILNTPMRPDHPTPDDQVPNVQPEIADADNYHWLALREFRANLESHPLEPAPASDDLAVVRERLTAALAGRPKVTADALATLTDSVEALGVPARDGAGAPKEPGSFINGYQSAIWPAELRADISTFASLVQLRAFTDTMFTVAQAARAARDQGAGTAGDLSELYVRMLVHLEDQGFAAGSSQGTIHHIGYQYRGFANSLLLVQPILEEKGLWSGLERTGMVLWPRPSRAGLRGCRSLRRTGRRAQHAPAGNRNRGTHGSDGRRASDGARWPHPVARSRPHLLTRA